MTIVLLPGLHGTDELFSWLINALKGEFPVFIIQYPPQECLSYAALAQRIGPSLPPECVLVAESFAGPLSVLLATAYPDRIKGIVFSGSFVRSPVGPFLKTLYAVLLPLLALICRMPATFLEEMAFRLGAYQFLLKGRSNPELISSLRKIAQGLVPSVILFRLGQLLRTDVSAQFTKLKIPLVYLRGSEDRLVPITNSEWMQKLNPNMAVREFQCGHLVLQLYANEAAHEIRALVYSGR